ncbi:MAG: hypothetical protein ACKVIX_08505 [Sphingomonadales bacterium]
MCFSFSSTVFSQKPIKTRANEWAKETGLLAGSASFCKIDEKTLEVYINKANSKIIATATDNTDIVVSKVEFSNFFNRASAIEPEEGCDAFVKLFSRELARIN